MKFTAKDVLFLSLLSVAMTAMFMAGFMAIEGHGPSWLGLCGIVGGVNGLTFGLGAVMQWADRPGTPCRR
jgi:hypothetical protein